MIELVKILRRCVECGRYTMARLTCPECGGKTMNPNPAKFSLTDKYGKYRRKLKKTEKKE